MPASGPRNVAGVSASGLLLSCWVLLISSFVSNSHLFLSYLVELVAFLCPLFVTTFLVVLLALFMLSPGFSQGETSGNGPGCVLGVCSVVLSKFRSSAEEGTLQQSDAFAGSEVYRIIFEVPDLESGRHGIGIEESEIPPVDKFLIYDDPGVRAPEATSAPHETDVSCQDEEIARADIESGKKSGTLFQEKPCCETEYLDVKDEDFHNRKRDSSQMKASEAKIDDGGDDNYSACIRRRFGEGDLGGSGSMRKGKEWNRTLACKLMEERQDEEGEKMDSLWETYEEEESVSSPSWEKDEKKKPKMMEGEGLVCCLQALRLSGGKMGVLRGMGRKLPADLVKISNAFRGIIRLHHRHAHRLPTTSHVNTNNNLNHANNCRN